MEIVKIFSEVDTDERLYSVLMTEEELSLYSDLEERMFNSKAQKILREKFETKVGKNIMKDYGSLNFGVSPESLNKYRSVARDHLKNSDIIGPLRGVNKKINLKAWELKNLGGSPRDHYRRWNRI